NKATVSAGDPAPDRGQIGGHQMLPTPLARSLVLAETESGLHAGLTATTFNFGAITDLWFRVQLPGMPSSTLLTVRFFDPSNHAFYTEHFAFSLDPQMTSMPMGNETMPVLQAEPLPGGFALDHYVPIAGSV